MLTRMEK